MGSEVIFFFLRIFLKKYLLSCKNHKFFLEGNNSIKLINDTLMKL